MKNILFSIAFAANCLLVFLLLTGDNMYVPAWLQVFGRAHPLLLHIPIGVLLLYAVIELFVPPKMEQLAEEWKDFLLLISAVTVSITALMGLFLSKEEGYDSGATDLHKWTGSAVSVLLIVWYQWRHSIRRKIVANKAIAAVAIITVTLAGHYGGNITHGEDFLIGPILKKPSDSVAVPIEEAIVFNHMVQPILNAKCVSCHNERKAKGELVLETAEMITKGGKNGRLWDTSANNPGLMMERIHLPLEAKEHMPPKGKPQLDDTEQIILERWIRGGGDFTVKVADLKPADTLKQLAEALFTSSEHETYTFASADENEIQSLNNFYRKVKPLFENSPALQVNFFERYRFKPEHLKELKKIKEQVVHLDLSKMPVEDDLLKDVAEFQNLRVLNLSFTNVTGKGLGELKKMQFLKELSLSGTKVDIGTVNILNDFPALKKVFLWNTRVTKEQVASLQKKKNAPLYEMGYGGADTTLLQLTPPIFENDVFVVSEPTDLKIKHKINGAKIRYTTDGSEPDSIKSKLYDGSVRIDKDVVVKAKVFREGWKSSEVKTAQFYMSTIKPDKVELLTTPDRLNKGTGSSTLFDKDLAGIPRIAGRWLGYRSPDFFEAKLYFEKQPRMKSVIVNFSTDYRGHVFEPVSITLWYGNDENNLKELKTIKPTLPRKKADPFSIGYRFDMPDQPLKYLRIKAVPIRRLPSWHENVKDGKGWILIDEIIIK